MNDPNINSNNMNIDPNMTSQNTNIDPMTGETTKDPEYLGKIFEIKKIYSRLASIESYLDDVRSYIIKT